MFVFDGTEKVGFDKYRELFIDNFAAISAIDAHIISAIPIASCYKLEHSAQQKLYERVDLPMFRLNTPEARAIFAEIITKRVDKESFIETDALDLAVRKSGGCARQLLDIAINAYKKARGSKINTTHLQSALNELGRRMNDHVGAEEGKILLLEGNTGIVEPYLEIAYYQIASLQKTARGFFGSKKAKQEIAGLRAEAGRLTEGIALSEAAQAWRDKIKAL